MLPTMTLTSTRDWLFALGCRAFGICLITAGAVAGSCGLWATLETRPSETGFRAYLDVLIAGLLIAITCTAIGFAVSYLGVSVFNFGRRWVSPPAAEKLRSDPRSPILYMRSFAHDKLTRRTHEMLLPPGFLLPTLRAFAPLGPVIAIGEPGEKLRPLGAARLLVGDKEWQAEVGALIAEARLLLIRAGTSPGVLCEIRLSVEQNRAQSLLLIVPVERDAYDLFRKMAQPLFSRDLPPSTGVTHDRRHSQAIISFDGAWTPTVHALKLKDYSLAPLEGALKRFIRKNPGIFLPRASNEESVLKAGLNFLRNTIGVLFAAVLAVPLVFMTFPKVKVIASYVHPHIFLRSPLERFVASMPVSLRAAMRAELKEEPVVRKWVEDSSSELWPLFGHEARLGLNSLRDEDLMDWSIVFQENLAARDTKSCAAAVRSLSKFPDESENLVPLLANAMPQSLIPKLARVLVKAAGAEITHAPERPPPTVEDEEYAKSELLRFVASAGAKRFEETLVSGPDRSGDVDVCWFQLTWMRAIQDASPRSRPVVITLYIFSFFPDAWKRDADKRKQALDEMEEEQRIRRLFRF